MGFYLEEESFGNVPSIHPNDAVLEFAPPAFATVSPLSALTAPPSVPVLAPPLPPLLLPPPPPLLLPFLESPSHAKPSED
ncbi:hypothetical protein K1719_047337 [Acacia pycnantha]|nr:hypothetical protein K1719_047337 [Acacia pycnantha]